LRSTSHATSVEHFFGTILTFLASPQPKEPPIPEKHGKILDDKLISFLLMATPLPSANAMATAPQLPLTFCRCPW
jgi:hypothetical protein